MSDTLLADPETSPRPAAAEPAAKRPRVLALANQKGGVGKTTTAINLGTALAAIGEQVLILDLDPQGNASTGLGIDRRNRRCSTYHVMAEEAPMRDAILATEVPRLSIAPSTLDLSGFDLEVGRSADRAFRLRRALEQLNAGAPEAAQFSYVLIDSPPSLNLLTINAMAAANAILVPLQCEFFALEGLSQLMKTVDQVKQSLNPDLIIHGIVLTMYDSRNNLSAQVVADVREFMGRKVYDTVIPRNVRISEAPSYGKPVLVYDLKCAGSEAYLRLATEIIQREKELLAASAETPPITAVPVATAPPVGTAPPAVREAPATEVNALNNGQTTNPQGQPDDAASENNQTDNRGVGGGQRNDGAHESERVNEQTNNNNPEGR